jgi:UDP-N-acetylmuramoylalanine--D-glutamate ligase
MKHKMFHNKKVVLVGLGILGGGLSMAKFILKEGGTLTILDKNKKENFSKEIKALSKYKVKYVFGEHKESDIVKADIIVCNPAVPYFSDFVTLARKHKKLIYNDFSLFQAYLAHIGNTTPQVWITGTRGKTTTTLWSAHLLGDTAIVGGNVVGNGLQKICYQKGKYFVLETSNFQLEYPLNESTHIPEVAVLTNIFTDHLNRHKTFEEYKRVKHTVFSYQNGSGVLLLNKKESSVKDIKQKNVIDISKINVATYTTKVFPTHQAVALSFAIATAKHFGISDKDIKARIKSLPQAPMRQEVITKVEGITYINDSAATSPEALLASLASFPKAVFIIGGTNAELDFKPHVTRQYYITHSQ